MQTVLIAAFSVGGATIVGTLIGFLFKNISHRFSDIVLGFASGVMLAAAILGLIVPSFEGRGRYTIFISVLGIFCGALVLTAIDRLVPHLHRLIGAPQEEHPISNTHIGKVMLFVLAIAIHNFPEGLAAGVGFGTGDTAAALTIAGGIALQNIPEGMVIVAPMLSVGVSKKRAFLIGAGTGLIEIIGTLIGYFAISISTAILPFALAFAGGTMLYIIGDEMIPETHSHGHELGATYSLLIGFVVMLLTDYFIG